MVMIASWKCVFSSPLDTSHFRCVRTKTTQSAVISQLVVRPGLVTASRSSSSGQWRDTMVSILEGYWHFPVLI